MANSDPNYLAGVIDGIKTDIADLKYGYDKLDNRIGSMEKKIYIGLGILTAINIAIPFIVKYLSFIYAW